MATHERFTIDCDVLPEVTACYLRIAGDEVAFIEAHTAHALPRLLAALEAHGKRPEDVKYLVVTHAHLDHAAGASAVLGACKNARLIAHPRAAKNLIEPSKLIAGATHVYGKDRFDTLYGRIDPIPAERVVALPDGGTFELGGATFTALHTAGHAWHHFAVDDPALSTVYTGDTFGLVYPALQAGGRFALLTTSPTGFHAAEAHKSIDRIVALRREAACLTHYGEVRDLEEIARQLRSWVDLSETWVNEAAASGEPDAALEARIDTQIRAAIAEKAPASNLRLDDAAWKAMAMDIELNAQGLAYAAQEKRKTTAA
ncbi:MAG: Beta-lactamase related protein [Labilithrix sp.]|nr:Beta-lactamase related protein [Labilithrix sp.]